MKQHEEAKKKEKKKEMEVRKGGDGRGRETAYDIVRRKMREDDF